MKGLQGGLAAAVAGGGLAWLATDRRKAFGKIAQLERLARDAHSSLLAVRGKAEAQLRQVNLELESTRQHSASALARAVERANNAEAEVGRLAQQVQTRRDEGRGWQQQLQQAQENLLAAQVALTSAQQAANQTHAINAELDGLRQQHATTQQSLSDCEARATQEMGRADMAEAEVGRLGREVTNRISEGQGWQQELQQAQEDLSAAQVDGRAAAQERDAVPDRLQAMQAEAATYKTSAERDASRANGLQQELDKNTREWDNERLGLQAEVKRLERRSLLVDSLESEVQGQARQLMEMESSLTGGEARADAANKAVQDLKQQVQQLQAQVEEGSNSRAAQAAQLNGVQNELGNTKQQLQALNTKSQEQQAALVLKGEQLQEAQEEKMQVRRDLDTLKGTAEEQGSALQLQAQELQRLEQELKAERQAAEVNLNRKDKELKVVQKKLEYITKKRAQQSNRKAALKKELAEPTGGQNAASEGSVVSEDTDAAQELASEKDFAGDDEDENDDEDGKEENGKGQEASPRSQTSPRISAAYPGESSEEASIADPCNAEADAALGVADGGGGFQKVRSRKKRSTGRQRRRTNRESRQPSRVLEVPRPAPTSNAPPTRRIRVLTVPRPY